MVRRALEATEALAREGISAEVIDPRTLAPLDIDTILTSLHKTGRLLIVDEDYAPCGVASEIAAQVMERAFDDLDAPVKRLSGVFSPAPYSAALFAPMAPDAPAINRAVRDLLAE
jgi:2-oxoisovalerate dehydrogenase E1 component